MDGGLYLGQAGVGEDGFLPGAIGPEVVEVAGEGAGEDGVDGRARFSDGRWLEIELTESFEKVIHKH